MAIDLNQTVDDELDQYLWSWVTVGDDRVCPDCDALAKLEPATYTEWTTKRSEPGRGDTVCGDNCRCVMVPEGMIELTADMAYNVKLDDPKLILKPEDTYELFGELDDLILEWKNKTGEMNLPPEYYDITSVQGRIDYLRNSFKSSEMFGTSMAKNIEIARMRMEEMAPPNVNVAADAEYFKGNRTKYAGYEEKTNTIHINPNNKYWQDPVANSKRLFESGYHSSPHPLHTVYHEIGHAKYNAEGGWDTSLNAKETAIAKRVSQYATTNQREFIAEVYAGIQAGMKFDAEIMRLYDKFKVARKIVKLPPELEALIEKAKREGRG